MSVKGCLCQFQQVCVTFLPLSCVFLAGIANATGLLVGEEKALRGGNSVPRSATSTSVNYAQLIVPGEVPRPGSLASPPAAPTPSTTPAPKDTLPSGNEVHGEGLVAGTETMDVFTNHKVSDATKRILSSLPSPVEVKVYVTPQDKMPTGTKKIETSIVNLLSELRVASNGTLVFSTVYLDAENVVAAPKGSQKRDTEGKDSIIEECMREKSVEPFSLRTMGEDAVTSKLVYSSIGVGYKGRKEEVIPQIMPQNIEKLEYRLVRTICKLTRDKQPVVALVAPTESVNIDPQYRRMLEQMGQPVPTSDDPYVYLEQILRREKYDVHRVELRQDSPLPDEYDTLVVVNPRELNERQRWEINRALSAGKSVVMAVQNYEWDYRPSRTGMSVSKREEKPRINDLLKGYGLGVGDDILMDVNHVPLTVQSSANALQASLGGGQTVNLPTHILVNSNSMAQDSSITSRLASMFYLWGSPLTIDQDILKKYGLEVKTLMSTTDRAWTMPASQQITSASFEPPASGGKKYPLMVTVTGQFPDAFRDKPRPAWPAEEPQMPGQPPKSSKPEEGEAKPITPAPGKLILLGCSEVFRKNFLQPGNLDLFLNSVDAVTLDENLSHVR